MGITWRDEGITAVASCDVAPGSGIARNKENKAQLRRGGKGCLSCTDEKLDAARGLRHRAAMKRVPVVFAMLLAATPAAAQELQIAEPISPEPRVISEQGPSPLHYRLSPHIVLPLIRIGPGLAVRIPTDNNTAKAAFALDLYGGAAIRFGRGASTGILAEAGYSYVGFSEHFFSTGIGLLYGIGRLPPPPGEKESLGRRRIGLVPHALVGYAYGGTAIGARTSLLLGYSIYGVELAHQVLFVGPRQIHEIHVTVTGIAPLGEDE